MNDGRNRVIIENVLPRVNNGQYPIKRVVGETVTVTADIFCDGHDEISAVLQYRKEADKDFVEIPMLPLVNDRWSGTFSTAEMSPYQYTLAAWVDPFKTWQVDLGKKYRAGQDIRLDLREGALMIRRAAGRADAKGTRELEGFAATLENAKDQDQAYAQAVDPALTTLMHLYPDRSLETRYEQELSVWVDPPKALFSAWYEIFPRSVGTNDPAVSHGTFAEVERIIPGVAAMGFDVLYFPPIHPIGETNRKGKNNNPQAESGEPGSPWAIGSEKGGHKSIAPELGTLADFHRLLDKAKQHNLDVALDIAFQCSPDHPYVRDHPEWFRHRADGTIRYAENPPKKYEDVYPLNFETENWRELWEELLSVFLYWAEQGVLFFRVDNPHTKPLPFWEWLIAEVKKEHPKAVFLSEAFTRPKVMYRLAKAGFTQSYTYFTWRNTKWEITEYMKELTRSAPRDFFRPNFWPNTPDILPEYLQFGGRPAFMVRHVLAATLASSYGIYGPAFELFENEAMPGKEEYLDSEKYEIKQWDWDKPGNLRDFISRINAIRRENEALHTTWNIRFLEAENDFVLLYAKTTSDLENIIIVAVNLDPYHTQSAWLNVPIEEFGMDEGHSYLAHDLLGDDKFIWHGSRNYVELAPHVQPVRIFRIRKRIRTETDFDYFM